MHLNVPDQSGWARCRGSYHCVTMARGSYRSTLSAFDSIAIITKLAVPPHLSPPSTALQLSPSLLRFALRTVARWALRSLAYPAWVQEWNRR